MPVVVDPAALAGYAAFPAELARNSYSYGQGQSSAGASIGFGT